MHPTQGFENCPEATPCNKNDLPQAQNSSPPETALAPSSFPGTIRGAEF